MRLVDGGSEHPRPAPGNRRGGASVTLVRLPMHCIVDVMRALGGQWHA